MNESEIRQRLEGLMESLTNVRPSGSAGGYVPVAPKAKTVDELLDNLNLQIKYTLFDLDATRRENKYLRQMLDRRPNLGDNRPDEF